MPFFSRHNNETERTASPPPGPTNEAPPKRRSGLFGRRRSLADSPTRNGTNHATSPTTSQSPQRRGFLSRDRADEDPSIHTARERVRLAERAELEADKALSSAKNAVREARNHVKRLEEEAAEQARLAKIKQSQARSLSKSAKHLGRHDHV